MGQADKTDTSSDQNNETKTDISEDVVDAEIVEDVETETKDNADSVTEPETEVEETPEADDDMSDVEGEIDPDEQPSDDVEEDADQNDADAEVIEETPEPEAPAEPAPAAAPVAVKKTGFVQTVVGGIIAAAFGFGAAVYLNGGLNKNDQALQDLSSAIASQSADIQALQSNQTAAQKAADDAQSALNASATALQDVVASVDGVNARIDDLAEAVTLLDGRITVMEKRPITQGLPSSAIEAYEREVEQLKAAVAAQREDAATMEENARMTAQQALARAALTRIVSALDSGAPFRVALTDFGSATGNAAPEALEVTADTGVPTLVILQDRFPDAARAALAAARKNEATEGNRLSSFLKTQLGARSVTPQEGADADSILSRAEAALRAGQLDQSLSEIAALPENAQAELAAWVTETEKRLAAVAASEAISQQLNAN